MKPDAIISAIKEFFFDILGYLLPGLFLISILIILIDDDIVYNSGKFFSKRFDESYIPYLFLASSYILGYGIYSLADFTDKIFFRISPNNIRQSRFSVLKIESTDEIDDNISKSVEYATVKLVLKELWLLRNNNIATLDDTLINSMSVRNLRNIVMSYITESDSKIYTFTFRSDICKHISAISLCVGIIGIISFIFYLIIFFLSKIVLKDFLNIVLKRVIIFKIDFFTFFWLIVLVIFSYLMLKTRMRFHSISSKIPFPIFLAKYFKIS